MAILTNQIGPFVFTVLKGVPQVPHLMAEKIERPGVNGTGFMQTGKRGATFDIESGVDLLDWTTAHTIAADYPTICNDAIYFLTVGGLNYASLGVGYVVESVEIISIRQLALGVGGLNSGNAWLAARWRLVPVTI